MKRLGLLVLALVLAFCLCNCNFPQNTEPNIPVNSHTSSPSDSNNESAESSSKTTTTSSNINDTSSEKDSTIEAPDDTAKEDFKFCYQQLTDEQKAIYDTLEKAVKNMEIGWIALETPVYTKYRRDINIIVAALQNDMPQYFWLPPAYYTGSSQDGETIRILFEGQDNLTYLIDKSDREKMEENLFTRIKEIKSQVTATTPFEIELQLHDILCSSVTYSYSTEDPLVYTAYGALVNGQAVCEGYSRAMQMLLAEYNIESTLVTGDSKGEGHMWNLVNLDNAWYHLDATWNDLPNGKVAHTYFNLTDEEIAKDHESYVTYLELNYEEIVSKTPKPYNFQIPVCNSTDNNYFVKKDYIYGPNDEEKIAKFLMEPFDIIEFRFSDDAFKAQFDADRETYLNVINKALKKGRSKFAISNYSTTENTLIVYN